MPLKDMLVHLDGGRDDNRRLEAAVNLAKEHGSFLTGLYVAPEVHGRSYSGQLLQGASAAMSATVAKAEKALQTLADAAERISDEARANFEQTATKAGISHAWHDIEGNLYDALSVHGRFCDVAVVGQGGEAKKRFGETATEHLLLSVGHPIMLIPRTGHFPIIGKRILIAWDRSPLAARAVHNARPFLRSADEVKVLAINLESEVHGGVPGSGICEHLSHHGIKANPEHIDVRNRDLSDVLLSKATEMDADLIIMGAYGHSRLRERILGGVTHNILHHTAVPVLMSH